MPGRSRLHPEDLGAAAVFAGTAARSVSLEAIDGPARVLRIGFRRTDPDIVRR